MFFIKFRMSIFVESLNLNNNKFQIMKKGMIFDLYQDGKSTVRVIAISGKDVVSLESFEVIRNIDFEQEVESILIDDIFDFE